MNDIRFEWDKNKNNSDVRKHKISFEEAKTVSLDENARLVPDAEHSFYEERFIILGFSNKLKLLVCSSYLCRRR